MDIKWRPVKLGCGHVFCIRCLIIMQGKKQEKCPLCRQSTVGAANSGKQGSQGCCVIFAETFADNLDHELSVFLKKWFPDEVKAKQKYNELMAGIDQYGEVYAKKCVVM
jgi:E3 ubiquitin-protein ligase BAH